MYTEIMFDAPTVLHPTTAATAQSLFPNYPHKYVFGVIIRVRTMGTATYFRLGNSTAQELTLDAVGETFTWQGLAGQVLDLAKVYVLSDQNDGELEILAQYVPVVPDATVTKAEGSGR